MNNNEQAVKDLLVLIDELKASDIPFTGALMKDLQATIDALEGEMPQQEIIPMIDMMIPVSLPTLSLAQTRIEAKLLYINNVLQEVANDLLELPLWNGDCCDEPEGQYVSGPFSEYGPGDVDGENPGVILCGDINTDSYFATHINYVQCANCSLMFQVIDIF